LAVQKINTYIAKQCSHVEFLYFVMGEHIWANDIGQATLSMKEGYILDVFGKLSMRRGAWTWFHDFWTCSAKVLEY